MGKFVVIELKGDVDYIERVIYGADIPFTELSTDESIIDRAKEFYPPQTTDFICSPKLVRDGYIKGATEQSLIEQMKAKEFAEWCSINEWYYSTASKGWHNPLHIHDFFTTEELFNQFTGFKTKISRTE